MRTKLNITLLNAPMVTEVVYSFTRLTGIKYWVPVTLLQAIKRIIGASRKITEPARTNYRPKTHGPNFLAIAIKPNIIGIAIADTKLKDEYKLLRTPFMSPLANLFAT